MLAGVGGEYLDEPVIIRQLLQPNLTGFETFAGEWPEFWLYLFRRRRSKVDFRLCAGCRRNCSNRRGRGTRGNR